MKKLNVTKEQFNRSNYFQRKYGKLEYVSESGRLFKTNKGKVLKFKESTMEPEDKFGEKYENFIVALEKYGSHGQVHMFGPENMYVSIPRLGIKDVYDEVDKIRMAAEEVGWSIPPEGDIEKSIMNDRRIAAEIDIFPAEEDLTGEYNESTRRARRSSRRFNESALPTIGDIFDDDVDEEELRHNFAEKLYDVYLQLLDFAKAAKEQLKDRGLAKSINEVASQVSNIAHEEV